MLELLNFELGLKKIPDLPKLCLALVFATVSTFSGFVGLVHIQSKKQGPGMEPWATSYTKFVSSLDDKVLNMIEAVRFFLVGFVARMSSLGSFGLGLGAI